MNNEYFEGPLVSYLSKHGLLSQATEYARVNAVGTNQLGYLNGRTSLWWAFSWSNTEEGYAYWSNHHEKYLIETRIGMRI